MNVNSVADDQLLSVDRSRQATLCFHAIKGRFAKSEFEAAGM